MCPHDHNACKTSVSANGLTPKAPKGQMPLPASIKDSLGVAILGCGFIGKVHAYAHRNTFNYPQFLLVSSLVPFT